MLPDSLKAFVDEIIKVCESQFPRDCTLCGKTYSNFKEYIEGTTPIGEAPISMSDDWKSDPIGMLSYVNCSCNTTITLKCEAQSEEMHEMFNSTVEQEILHSGKPKDELMALLREAIRAKMDSKA